MEALGRPADERAVFLSARCPDPVQRARIEKLLDAHERAPAILRPVCPRPAAAEPERGTVIGRYRLREKIGEGGCGIVWMAQQEEPVRRRVALKMIKLGMDTREVMARFDAERRALGLMEHPHIAQVLDAGVTDGGRPYFVMELVRGQPITRYCDERNLTLPDRLALFVQVCRAVDHAHRRGVVHRDLKPSNILVTNDGYRPVPKVIDFGIAKSLQGRLTDKTVFTAFEQFLGTPAYMSPEQADFSAHEVDAGSDVYSLGVLLYEMLTGRPPFDPKSLASAGFDEARRIIREDEPPRPAHRLGTMDRVERTSLAQRRRLAVAEHVSLVTGEIERVVLKAIAKSRAHRYASAAELADDVERFLRSEPVAARARRSFAALRGIVRRRRTELLAGVAVAGAVAFGVVQARRAARAEEEKTRLLQPPAGVPVRVAAATTPVGPLRAAREFIATLEENFFGEPVPVATESAIAARAQQAVKALDGIATAARGPEWLRERTLAQARLALAQFRQGRATAPAIAVRQDAQRLRQDGDDSPDAVWLDVVAQSIERDPSLASIIDPLAPDAGTYAAGEALLAADRLLRPLALAPEAPARWRVRLAELLQARAQLERSDAGSALLRDALAVLDDSALAAQPAHQLGRAKLLHLLGRRLRAAEGQRCQQEARSLCLAVLAARPASMEARRTLALAQLELGRLAEAREDDAAALNSRREAHRLAREVQRFDPGRDDDWRLLRHAALALGSALTDRGRIAEAVALYQRLAEDGNQPLTGPKSGAKPRAGLRPLFETLAFLEAARGHFEAADQTRRAALQHPAAGEFPGATATTLGLRDRLAAARLGRTLNLMGGRPEAVLTAGEKTRAELLAALGRPGTPEAEKTLHAPEVVSLFEQMAEACVRLGRFDEAARLAIPPALSAPGNSHESPAFSLWRALALARLGRGAEALAVVEKLRPELPAGKKIAQRTLLARALHVEAVAQPDSDLGRQRALAALDQAAAILDAMTAEARQLYPQRMLAKDLAAERARRSGARE